MLQGSSDNGLHSVTSAIQGSVYGSFVGSNVKEGSNDNKDDGSMVCAISNDTYSNLSSLA